MNGVIQLLMKLREFLIKIIDEEIKSDSELLNKFKESEDAEWYENFIKWLEKRIGKLKEAKQRLMELDPWI